MAFPYLDAAGRERVPAVIIHPDQELPKVWRVLSTWEQVVYGEAPAVHARGCEGIERGQNGAPYCPRHSARGT
jgi:hypothetical protein